MSLFYRSVFVLTFSLLAAFSVPAQSVRKPNIILIMADDLGYGDLSSYGHPLIRTENLDHLADEGMRLTSFYVSASTCTPSRASLLTGRYPLRSGLPIVLYPEDDKGLPASELTLAEALKEQGYATMCIGKWHLGQTRHEYLPTSQGFDQYYGLITSNDMKSPWVKTDVPLKLYRDDKPLNKEVNQATLTKDYTAEAIKFIDQSAKSSFFLYLPHSMPHVPISASEDFKGTSKAGLYGDVVEEIDWGVGEILAKLKEKKIEKNTIVVFLSDNGPWNFMSDRMFAEDIVKPWHAGTTGLLRGGKINSYEGGFRVPCIIRWPGVIEPGSVSSQVSTSMDLYMTLIAAAGGSVPKETIVDGVDITPLLKGDTTFSRGKDFYYFQGIYLEAVRSGDWKLRIAPFQGPALPRNDALEPELYNLVTDPSERTNQAHLHPEIVEELKAKMLEFTIEGAVKRFE